MPPKRTSSSKPRASSRAPSAATPARGASNSGRGRSASPAGRKSSVPAASPKARLPPQLPPSKSKKGSSVSLQTTSQPRASRARSTSTSKPAAAASNNTKKKALSSSRALSSNNNRRKSVSVAEADDDENAEEEEEEEEFDELRRAVQSTIANAAGQLVEAVLGNSEERQARATRTRNRTRSSALMSSQQASGELTEEQTNRLKRRVAKEGVMTMADHLQAAIDGDTDCQECDDADGGDHNGDKKATASGEEVDFLALSDPLERAHALGRLSDSDKAAIAANNKKGRDAAFKSRPIRSDDGSLPLYTHGEAPRWMQHNPFILASYRAHYSFSMCLRSLFALHNETSNVWTHLLGLVFFLALCTYCLMNVIKAEFTHIAIFLLFSLGNVLCMGCSACFHLFSAHHCERVYSRMIMMDYFGITSLIIASFYPVCYYGFACEPFWRWTYMLIISALGLTGLVGPFFDFFLSDDFSIYRLGIFIGLTSSGVFPLIHVNFLMPEHESTPFVKGIALMLFLYGTGVLIYVLKVPERLRPGRFDIWFHSHQLWHVFVLAASVVHFFTCLDTYMRWENMDTQC